MRYWTKISENEKGGHSDTGQGNPKGCSLERQADVYILTNMHAPPVEGNFTHESGQAIKPRVVEDYNACMGFVDKSDRMVNSYGIAPRTWKWTKKLFFSLSRHDHSKRISYTQVMQWQNNAQKFPLNSLSRIDYPFTRRNCKS